MKKKLMLLCAVIALLCGSVYAQEWSREDSTWLINVLEGRDVKINEDTKKAIEDGRLIVPQWMKNADSRLHLLEAPKDAGTVDSLRIQGIDPYTMPPAVFALYILYMEKVDSVNESRSCVLSKAERESMEAALPPGVKSGFYVTECVGSFGGRDFNHILSMVFSPSYRQKAHNRKYAVNYKFYYDENAAARSMGFTERERRQMRNELVRIKVAPTRMPGVKTGGIDD